MGLETTDTGLWTYERMVAELPPESRYEILDGVLLDMSPSPTPFHQDILFNLASIFRAFLKAHMLGKAFIAPLDIRLDQGNVVQPDIMVVMGEVEVPKAGLLPQKPELVVEILSPGSVKLDRFKKKELYERFGIKEFWLIDPAYESVEVNVLEAGAYRLHDYMEGEGSVSSILLSELTVLYEDVFAR